MRHGRTYSEGHHIYSSKIPTLVGPKGVYCHPRMREFLKCVSDFATRIVVWSSMKRTTLSWSTTPFCDPRPRPLPNH